MKVNPKTLDAYNLLHYGTLALAKAERTGIRVDIEYIERKKMFLTRRMKKIEEDFKKTKFFRHWEHSTKGTVNINSDIQLAQFLYGVKKIKPSRLTASGKGATDEEALRELNIPELDLLLKRSKLKKAHDVLDGFYQEQVNGYIHPNFNLNMVITFRSSSDSPNIQNIPKRDDEMANICRKALYPRPGHQLLEVDFGSLEVRIATCYHKDSRMLKYLKDPKSDMHRDMAQQIFFIDEYDKVNHYVLRQAAKNGFVFPEFYGDYYKNCAVNMAYGWCKLPQSSWKSGQGIMVNGSHIADHLISKGIRSLNSFEKHIQKIEKDFWSRRFSEYADWKERWWSVYKKYGYIDMLTGFRCSGVMSRNDCTNYPVQGAAFHCLLWSFIEMEKTIFHKKWDTKLIGQIHDSIIMDVNPSELEEVIQTIRKITCEDLPKAWEWIIVPLEIDMELSPVDASWMDKTKLK